MKRNVIACLVLFFISISTCYASWTVIRTPYGNTVQCNKWGLVKNNAQTAWPNTCAPLEVVAFNGSTLSVASTAGKCGDKEIAYYYYEPDFTEIEFRGCYQGPNNEFLKNISR